ncbi:YciI family protein [Chitinivorax sp. B]|uniref:YciI family protein n=1 Tax=Chitinivorax sp. B TaxID=2502235 RepID=UPI0010F6BCB9|nr:YciI family protein [Chitinivorax sp. B]
MLYVMIGTDAPDSLDTRLSVRAAHLARLQALQDAGRLLVAGPCPSIDSPDPGPAGFSGSIVIAEFDSLEAAERWFNDDVYVTKGVFSHISVKPFKKVLPT